MLEIDRIALILKPSQKMLDWIITLSDDNAVLSLDDLQDDCTVLLMPFFEEEEDMLDYFENNFEEIFTSELFAWTMDESLWPTDRDFSLFRQWFAIEEHSMVFDLAEDDQIFSEDDDDDDDENDDHKIIERYN